MKGPSFYAISVEDHLSDSWSDWFEGLEIQSGSDGATTLCGLFSDQAALFGALAKIQALNLTLISVRRGSVPPETDRSPA